MKHIENIKKLLTLAGLRHFLKILTKQEKIVFFASLCLFLFSSFFLTINFYLKNTEVVPAEYGNYTEGILGSPRWINPVYPLNDADRDLIEIIFSGLMKYDSEGKVVPDLAEKCEVMENGKVYECTLRENLFWSDSEAITADDVIFTIETIQNADIKSPLRSTWLGVEIEKVADSQERKVRFKLKNSYSGFSENLTLKIIPKHLWENITPQNFPLTYLNLSPVGSGPYKLKNFSSDKDGKITSLVLIKNPYYFNDPAHLSQISFNFFEKKEDLIKAAQLKKIDGLALASTKELSTNITNLNSYSLSLPRYFAVFLNQKDSKILIDKNVRQALNYATDKSELINSVLGGEGKVVDSPILPEIYGFNAPLKIYEFNIDKANELLEKAGFSKNQEGLREKITEKKPAFQFKSNLTLNSQGTEVTELQKCLARDKQIYPEGEITGYFGQKTKEAVIRFQEKYKNEILTPQQLEKGTGDVKAGTRDVLNRVCLENPEEKTPLKLTLATIDQPELIEAANLLKEQWKKIGADIEVKTYDVSALEKDIIKPRNYDMLLFGEVLGLIPDPFPFWHSSQKKDPGLNLSYYENKNVDKLLEEARQNLNDSERKEKLEKFQDLLIEDAPAVFLYNPDYSHLVSKKIKGIESKIISDPSERFLEIENWYIKTKRTWK